MWVKVTFLESTEIGGQRPRQLGNSFLFDITEDNKIGTFNILYSRIVAEEERLTEALSSRAVLYLTVENSKEANNILKAKLEHQLCVFLDFFASQSFDRIVFFMAPLATTLIIQASVIADRPLPSFSVFLPAVANTLLPLTIEAYRVRVLMKYPNSLSDDFVYFSAVYLCVIGATDAQSIVLYSIRCCLMSLKRRSPLQ